MSNEKIGNNGAGDDTDTGNNEDFDIDITGKIKKIVLNEKFIIGFLFVFSIVIRILYKNAGLWHFDSLADAMTVEDMLETGRLQYSYAYGAPGAMVTIFAVYFLHHLITGTTSAEFSYFFVTFVTAALSVVLLYLVTKHITKNRFISTSAAMLFSVTPVFLSVTTFPKTHAISIFYALLAGYIILIAAERNSWKLLAVAGLLTGINLAIRVDAVLYLLPFALLYINPRIENKKLLLRKERLSIKNITAFALPIIIVWLVLFIPRIIDMGGIAPFIEDLNPKTETRGGWLGIISENTIPSFLNITISVTWIGWLAVLLGMFYFYIKRMKLELISLIGWFLIFFLLFGNLLVNHVRFILPGLIPVMMLMAAGCYVVYNQNRIAGYVVVIFLIGSMFYNIYPIISYRHEHSGTKDFAMYVDANTPENAVVMANDLGFFIKYYAKRKTITHPRDGNPDEIARFILQLFNYTKEGRPIYSTAEGFGIDPGGFVQKAVLNYFDISLIGEHANEWYGRGTLNLDVYNEKLFKLELKKEYAGKLPEVNI